MPAEPVRLVLDTSVLIDHLRGRPRAATTLIPNAIARGHELWSSEAVRAELLAGMRLEEEGATRALMGLISWVEVDEGVAEAAGALGRRYLRSHPGIDVADLIVAALAQQLRADLKTTNVKHYPMIDGLRPAY
jgi:predicted nucleic acid-binding protein